MCASLNINYILSLLCLQCLLQVEQSSVCSISYSLFSAYEKCSTVKERELLLARLKSGNANR